jgi:serine/threonine-protein kinase
LHAAHEVRDSAGHIQGVVHRDISPDNLLLGFDGHVKVIDFGIALVKNRQSPVTEFGTVKGKPPYMSPEQVKNAALDRRSDVFSLGVVLHEMLTGEMLFDGDSIYAIALKVENLKIEPPSQVLGKPLPTGLDAVVMAALERDPARRIPTAAAFAEQLEQVIGSAGDETLEAWSERSLADARDQHRAWLAEVVAGRDKPRPIGRATGSVTALGPLALVDQIAPTPLAIEKPPAAFDDVPPRRRLGLPIAMMVLLALAIVGVVMLTRSPKATAIDASVDTSIDTPVVVVAPPDTTPDVAEPDAAIVDAAVIAVAKDAAPRRPPPDAPAPKPDAATVEPAVVGNGKLIVKHHASSKTSLDVLVDNKRVGQTPTLPFLTVPAGSHAIALVSPVSGEVVYRTTVTISDGKTEVVVQPAP